MRGRFITFEGGDGAGKSTQARRLAERLQGEGITVTLTREPGGSPLAERLRTALIGPAGAALSADQQAVIFAAARADHVATVIAPALDAGTWVLSDRFADSTEAYQGAAGASATLMAALRTLAVGRTEPDLTLVLDVAPEAALARMAARTLDPFEREGAATLNARRDAFTIIARREPQRCALIDASADENTIADAIWRVVTDRLAVGTGA